MEEITGKIEMLDISKFEDNEFRFIGIDVEKVDRNIEIGMDDYGKSLEKLEVRKSKSDE